MAATSPSIIDFRPSATRFPTNIGWLDSKHSFSFGHHFDPDNMGHGLLLVMNDDRVAAGGGFTPHSHSDMEIVTWVLEGALEHRDSQGNHGVLYPGLAQRMSAGSGITHSEMNASKEEPVHFLQMWVRPDTAGVTPSYEERDLNDTLAAGGLVPVASGRGHEGAVAIHQRGAVLWIGRLTDGETVDLPDAEYVHVFLAKGSAVFEDQTLVAGDAVRLTNAGATSLTSQGDAEVVIWETNVSATS